MAFDGITVHALTYELKNILSGGRINKIAQTEKDELILTIKGASGQNRLLICANPSLPLVYITSTNKPAPLTAPGFCMLLRKHINNGRIVDVTQPGLERIIDFKIEHLDEMGDLCTKHLIVELMGKHSNIIFLDDNNHIIDSIKRINAGISSVREVLPGREYFIPNTSGKVNPFEADRASFASLIGSKAEPSDKAIYGSYTGISPQFANEICYRAGIDPNAPASSLSENELAHLAGVFTNTIDDIRNNNFSYNIIYEHDIPKEFMVVTPSMYEGLTIVPCEKASSMLEKYYADKNLVTRIRQRSADLRQVVNTALERNYKKYDLQAKQLKDTDKRDKYRIYGELLNTYGYNIPEGSSSFEALNYYDNTMLTIPLDKDLTARENSVKYFAKYNKLKRTYEALSELITQTKDEIEHLESIATSIDIATSYDDLIQIKEELVNFGFIKSHQTGRKDKAEHSKSKPWHYVSSDGFDIFVGRNNIQNEELTFRMASGNDWWFHAKNMPGSHVIVKCDNRELPDSTYEEAAALAAYYSKGRAQEKVDVDYVQKKHLSKVAGKAPGFVIYHTNYSMTIAPSASLKEIK
ncbi:MAG: NFACT RNA binding domain-containing protein [Lachnospiraceae bacterium]|nr:NFACT RNA binding domain-containing protein [Lachnospiraceae bacterium]